MRASPTAQDYLAGPTLGWTIVLLDLGVALPATVAVCVARPGRTAGPTLTGWFALVGAAVAATAIAVYRPILRGRAEAALGLAHRRAAVGLTAHR
jgi:hypothetical protein